MADIEFVNLTESKHVVLTDGQTCMLIIESPDLRTEIFYELLAHTEAGALWARELLMTEVDADGVGAPIVVPLEDGSDVILNGRNRFYLGKRCGVMMTAVGDVTASFQVIGQTL